MEEIAENLYFKWHDFVLFAIVLITSSLIGLYFGIVGRRKETVNEYLLGGNSMGVVPIAFSLTSSVITPLTMVAVPCEYYRFGIASIFIGISIQLSLVFIYFGILPVFWNLHLTSIYEYIELRFNGLMRKICSVLYAITMVTFLPVIVFIPAIALAQGTGFDMQYVTFVVSIICTFYTAIGGIKAVIWTDTFQFIIMIITSTAVALLGTNKSEGFEQIVADSRSGGRLDIDFSFDPTRTYAFWPLVIGYGFYWIQYIGANQACIQKCLTLPSKEHIKRSFILFGVCIGLLWVTTHYTGLILYSKYKDCDPYSAQQIQYHDQLLPFYILHVLGDFPGLSGLFIAGIFSATLSSLSAGMNALSCTIYNDFISSLLDRKASEAKKNFILKLIVVAVGVVVTLLVFVVGKFGTMTAVAMSFGGLFAGPVFGVFLLGLFSRRANSKAAFWGIVGSLVILSWIFIGQQFYKFNNLAKDESIPVSVQGCPQHLNFTTITQESQGDPQIFFPYEISFFYFTLLGSLLTVLIGLPIGFLGETLEVPDKYLSPLRLWEKQKEYFQVKIDNNQEEQVL